MHREKTKRRLQALKQVRRHIAATCKPRQGRSVRGVDPRSRPQSERQNLDYGCRRREGSAPVMGNEQNDATADN